MGGNAIQPVIQATHIHGRRSHDMLKMGPRFSNVARTPQAHRTHSLGMNPFYPSALSIGFFELLGLLSRTRCRQRKMGIMSPYREGPLS